MATDAVAQLRRRFRERCYEAGTRSSNGQRVRTVTRTTYPIPLDLTSYLPLPEPVQVETFDLPAYHHGRWCTRPAEWLQAELLAGDEAPACLGSSNAS